MNLNCDRCASMYGFDRNDSRVQEATHAVKWGKSVAYFCTDHFEQLDPKPYPCDNCEVYITESVTLFENDGDYCSYDCANAHIEPKHRFRIRVAGTGAKYGNCEICSQHAHTVFKLFHEKSFINPWGEESWQILPTTFGHYSCMKKTMEKYQSYEIW